MGDRKRLKYWEEPAPPGPPRLRRLAQGVVQLRRTPLPATPSQAARLRTASYMAHELPRTRLVLSQRALAAPAASAEARRRLAVRAIFDAAPDERLVQQRTLQYFEASDEAAAARRALETDTARSERELGALPREPWHRNAGVVAAFDAGAAGVPPLRYMALQLLAGALDDEDVRDALRVLPEPVLEDLRATLERRGTASRRSAVTRAPIFRLLDGPSPATHFRFDPPPPPGGGNGLAV
jgi:hypothetical protein